MYVDWLTALVFTRFSGLWVEFNSVSQKGGLYVGEYLAHVNVLVLKFLDKMAFIPLKEKRYSIYRTVFGLLQTLIWLFVPQRKCFAPSYCISPFLTIFLAVPVWVNLRESVWIFIIDSLFKTLALRRNSSHLNY